MTHLRMQKTTPGSKDAHLAQNIKQWPENWQETQGGQIWWKSVFRSKMYYCCTQKIISQTESGVYQLFEECTEGWCKCRAREKSVQSSIDFLLTYVAFSSQNTICSCFSWRSRALTHSKKWKRISVKSQKRRHLSMMSSSANFMVIAVFHIFPVV